jgi:hypothetical protein
MSPGRDLDRLIAEKVMGRKVYGDRISREAPELDIPECWLPRYSSDIAAAWEVVEKLRDSNFQLTLVTTKLSALATFYTPQERIIWDNSLPEGHTPLKAIGDTAPHAICLAALKAMGVEV